MTPPTTSFEDEIQDLNDHCTDTYGPMLFDDTNESTTPGPAQEQPTNTIQLDGFQFEEENLMLDDKLLGQTDHDKDTLRPNEWTTLSIRSLISRIAVGQSTDYRYPPCLIPATMAYPLFGAAYSHNIMHIMPNGNPSEKIPSPILFSASRRWIPSAHPGIHWGRDGNDGYSVFRSWLPSMLSAAHYGSSILCLRMFLWNYF
jgi:hypothetical protein